MQVTNILKYLFPAPKEESKRVIAFANDDDFISFRHHTYTKVNHKEVDLQEVRRHAIPDAFCEGFVSLLVDGSRLMWKSRVF